MPVVLAVRERVLQQPVHELVWGSGARLSLQVTALPADGDPAQVRGARVRGAGEGGAGGTAVTALLSFLCRRRERPPGPRCQVGAGQERRGAPGLARRAQPPARPGRANGAGAL